MPKWGADRVSPLLNGAAWMPPTAADRGAALQRRRRNCLVGMRAEPYEYGAPESVDLELFLMWRARGMTIETPAVRP